MPKKGNRTTQDFLNDDHKAALIISSSKKTFKDAAAINASRKRIGEALMLIGKQVSFGSGSQTKYNRTRYGLEKDHWTHAACIRNLEKELKIPKKISLLEIVATGRGRRQQCLVNRFGFPRSMAKQKKRVFGFQTGDLVKASVPTSKKQGHCRGRVAVKSTSNFNIRTTSGVVEGIPAKYCLVSQRRDSYSYIHLKKEQRFFP